MREREVSGKEIWKKNRFKMAANLQSLYEIAANLKKSLQEESCHLKLTGDSRPLKNSKNPTKSLGYTITYSFYLFWIHFGINAVTIKIARYLSFTFDLIKFERLIQSYTNFQIYLFKSCFFEVRSKIWTAFITK